MPASTRRVTPDDLLPDVEFAKVRRERRAALLPVKRLRRIELGPICTVYFECYETMLFQIQEMLLTERGGLAQVPDELDAYNPLIPQGRELVATVMFEIDDPVRREAVLARLGGAEDCFYVAIGAERVMAVPEGDVERTRRIARPTAVTSTRPVSATWSIALCVSEPTILWVEVRTASAPSARADSGTSGWKPKCGPHDWSTTSGTPAACATCAQPPTSATMP